MGPNKGKMSFFIFYRYKIDEIIEIVKLSTIFLIILKEIEFYEIWGFHVIQLNQ